MGKLSNLLIPLIFTTMVLCAENLFSPSICTAEQINIDPAVKSIMDSSSNISAKTQKLKKMANAGNHNAALTLGLIYHLGLQGASKNAAEGTKWYKFAAQKGNVDAQLLLGECYAGGNGVPMDMAEAVMWLKKAAKSGNEDAQKFLAEVEESMWLNRTGWVSFQEVCRSGKMSCDQSVVVTGNSLINHWAGDVTEFYFVKGDKEFRRAKIYITWVTDKSPYNCGQTIEKNFSEIKDLTARSIALRRCN